MKKILLVLAVLSAAFAASCSKSDELKVMSYNIRLDHPNDGDNAWPNRKEATIEMINTLKPDVFGVQEALPHQVQYVAENALNYACAGVGREDGVSKGEHMSIYWNKETIEMIEWGTYWLSETPEEPSFGWDAACKRTATWAKMKDKRNGKYFFFVNTHLDHKGEMAQKNGLQLLVERIAAMNPESYPMVLTGDFNVKPENPALADLDKVMTSTRKVAEKTDNLDTFNGWGKGSGVIDYIYASGFSSVPEYRTIVEQFCEKPYISDHYPIISVLKY